MADIETVDQLVDRIHGMTALMGNKLRREEVKDVIRALADLSVQPPRDPSGPIVLEVLTEYGFRRQAR